MLLRRVHITLAGGVLLLKLLIPQAVLISEVLDSVKDRYYSALAMIGQDQFDPGISGLREIILENPTYSKPYRSLVETYIFVDQLDSAEIFFESVRQHYPNNAYAYYALARIDFAQKNLDAAMEKLKKCIGLDPKFADAYSHRGGLPEVYRAKKDLDSAMDFFTRLTEEQPENACAYYGLARCHIRKFQYEEALKQLEKALELDPRFTLAYHAKIQANSRLSQYRNVLQISQTSIEIAKAVDDLEMVAYANMMIGTANRIYGDYSKALNYLGDALSIAKNIGDKAREGACLNNLANVYYTLGDFSKALYYLHEALLFRRKTGNKLGEIRTLNNIGNVHMVEGRNEKANQYYREVLNLARLRGDKVSESRALLSISTVYRMGGDYEGALEYRMQALRVAQESKDRAQEGFVLSRLGLLHSRLKQYLDSADYYYRALRIGKETGNVQLIWQTETGLGVMLAKQRDRKKAIQHFANAISLYDSVRTNLDIESLSASFLEKKHRPYPGIVQLLAEQGEYEAAFVYGEKYRAKNLLEMLAQGESLATTALPDSLRRELHRIKYEQEQLHKELSSELSMGSATQKKLVDLEQKITSLKLQRASILGDLKRQRNIYYQLTSEEILGIEDIQSRVLSKSQVLVDYIVGSEALSVFVITPDSVIYQQTPIKADSLQTMLAALSPIFKRSSDRGNQITTPQLADFSVLPAFKLYEALFKPIEPYLGNIQEIIIVPDDLLFHLPFELLVYDTTGIETRYDFERAKFLLERYAISYAPSASLLNPELRHHRKPVKGVLAFGNPDFGSSADDPNPSELLAATTSDIGMVPREDQLVALPNSEFEVRSIDDVFGNFENRILLGADATEAAFKVNAQGFSILHLATHFLPMDDQPLYSKIMLSKDGTSGEDGYLQTYEVFNLKLDADLVVLSACNTASGRLRKGEGVIGIARAFQHAGVPSLLASLWSVDDASTASIMRAFYQHIKDGYTKNKALQLAKLDYLRSSDNSGRDPFYWAPFVLIGDRSPIQLPAKSSRNLWPFWLAMLVVAAIATVVIRNRTRFRTSQ